MAVIRTLSETQRQAYFAALRTMRTTSMAAGQRRFGAAYRSHAYMLLKHATSALHPCVDQGHDIENQMTFHRALLLEVEASVLAIVSTLEPNVTLGALPYWDFATDIAQTGNWWSGSLWKYWGSPFGDPDNDYCIEDPVFESKVERGMVPELQPLMNEIFGMDAESDGDFVMGNGHGWWRSPWNQAQCPGLARNPGWVLGAPTAIGSTFRDCQGASNYTVFMMCVQGRGFTRQGPDIGPHNAPHVSMGTFYDEGVGDAVFVTMLAFLSLGTFASACMSVLCFGKLRAEAKGTEMHWPSRWSWMLSVLLSLSIIGCFAAPAVHEAVVGVSGASLHVRWLRETFKRQSIDFKGTEWRSGALQCPASGTCVEGERCACSLNRYECGFVGADFWDGAFSLNENFFYSIHAFTDLLHLRWAAQRSEAPILANNFGGFPLVGRCPGMALEDDISEEFCFSSNDIGVSNLTGSGDASTPAHSANPKEPCLTHADILALNSPSLHDDRALLPYTYDVLVADAVWRPIEPTLECTKEIACDRSGNERNASLLRDMRAHGDFVCMPTMTEKKISPSPD
ncbi:Hypothetical Protein FCC1311_100722 [Hondaea fermentalgiana]|uniref:Tyrosinase copper-binding domain-containing protein n=1 Tax=Hondaea fermentalgiana TaxID=2315210 RepID=A0A2R5GU51_9STRA|nr:Hypothetical Protein FCC1311_100722 [Hondaea fermentalgiana]|eukprot:GBG33849.1 Hypothetical Protein FCC1311_100722 [Hondaea fermentalgiana]